MTCLILFYHQSNESYWTYKDGQIKNNGLINFTRNEGISLANGLTNSPTQNPKFYNGTHLNGTANSPVKSAFQQVNGNESFKPTLWKHEARPRSISKSTSPPADKQVVPELPNNARVGKYTIMRTVGRGNFAQVKLAVHLTTGCEVSVKFLRNVGE